MKLILPYDFRPTGRLAIVPSGVAAFSVVDFSHKLRRHFRLGPFIFFHFFAHSAAPRRWRLFGRPLRRPGRPVRRTASASVAPTPVGAHLNLQMVARGDITCGERGRGAAEDRRRRPSSGPIRRRRHCPGSAAPTGRLGHPLNPQSTPESVGLSTARDASEPRVWRGSCERSRVLIGGADGVEGDGGDGDRSHSSFCTPGAVGAVGGVDSVVYRDRAVSGCTRRARTGRFETLRRERR